MDIAHSSYVIVGGGFEIMLPYVHSQNFPMFPSYYSSVNLLFIINVLQF